MKKTIGLFGAIMIMFSLLSWGQDIMSTPVLRFNEDGKFKIVQFTDIHYQYNSYRSDSALVLMKTVLEREKPDLVVLTGDIVCTTNTTLAWLDLSKVLIDAKVPWAAVLGNHDAEFKYNTTKEQIFETMVGLPYNLTQGGPEDVSGEGNYVLEVKSSTSNKNAALFYFFDSQMGFHPKGNMGSYEWINFDQIAWYREQSRDYSMKNGVSPYPALAFFHIPLPEYKEVIGKSTTVGLQKETVCSPDLNSGMYTAMLECKDVMGTFVGHDHNNNYIGCLRDICLAYGNVTGRQCYGDIGRGARVIELYEGERKFDTWILKLYDCDRDKDIWTPTYDYEKKFFVTYPDSFIEK
ncbi:metallophosphatase [Mariniphaga sediminis]|uniref:Metallophosphatase n=1 Tax=Mariniphaga sediminis TaxID=1628158 RepID=A0A399CWD3_9BACT|nr:metallophosphoesterase family protein [Mariniphaga sediminis]RIH64014.1 metallophosphatase [Mariniphaga sediminis]